jgi:phage I-like protein
VNLSAEEREVARSSGISEVEYAKNKLKLMRMKAAGEIQ